jgi:carbamoyltransferase
MRSLWLNILFIGEFCLMPTDILGVSAFYHDSAACLVRDGQIVAAAQEERFTRKKSTPVSPPTESATGCNRLELAV